MILSETKDPRYILSIFQKSRSSGLKVALEDIRSFAKFFGCKEGEVPEILFGKIATEAKTNEIVLRYKQQLKENGKAFGTIKRRIGALRSLAKIAKGLGFIAWSIEVRAEPTRRDTRGLSAAAERKIPWLLDRNDPRGRRDLAILATIHELDSTRSETVILDLDNYNPDPRRPSIRSRGNPMPISIQSKKILDAWIEIRGFKVGPLFTRLDKSQEPTNERLSAEDLIPVVRDSYEIDEDLA
jgi:integrase